MYFLQYVHQSNMFEALPPSLSTAPTGLACSLHHQQEDETAPIIGKECHMGLARPHQ